MAVECAVVQVTTHEEDVSPDTTKTLLLVVGGIAAGAVVASMIGK